jgi:hypothetical protein
LVLQCEDISKNKVAIKVMKEDAKTKEQAKSEIEILNFVNKVDHDRGFIVRLLDQFRFTHTN